MEPVEPACVIAFDVVDVVDIAVVAVVAVVFGVDVLDELSELKAEFLVLPLTELLTELDENVATGA